MTDAYTYVAKPTGTPYTNVNAEGRYQYDESSILYDDPSIFYDGINFSAYTNIAKPTGGTTVIISAGMATGLIIPPTYATAHTITVGDPYTYVSKPIT